MKIHELSNKNRTWYRWTGCVAASLLAAALAGCGGGGGGDTTASSGTGGGGAAPAPTVPTVTAPTGTAPVTLTAATPAATFAALAPAVAVGGVSINSPPCVSFSMADASGNGIIGFGSKSQSSTATVASYPNLAFSLAKLVPGTNGAPSKWVSYIVTTVPTKNATTGAITDAAPTRPSTDNTGTLTDNKNGTYSYCFYRDVKKIKDQVAAMTPASGASLSDLGDLTYEPTLTHRLMIQISGNAPGTGTNTSDGVQTTAGVPMENPINVIYDFVPSTGKAVTSSDLTRNIADVSKCNECHSSLGGKPGETKLIDSQDGKSRVKASAGFHGSARNDVRTCTVCHTDQRKYGRTNTASTSLDFTAGKGLTRTVTQSSSTGLYSESYSPTTYIADGVVLGDLPVLIHKIHLGKELAKKNYNFANVRFNEVTYPQPITNCVKCHDGSATSTAKTTNGDNWKSVPSRLACGACHDGIDFAKNTGVNMADAFKGKTSSSIPHIGGAKSDDSQCVLCHTSTDIPVYHRTVDPELSSANSRAYYNAPYGCSTSATATLKCTTVAQVPAAASQLGDLPTGVFKINFEIKSVTVASNKATVEYRILKDGTAVKLNASGNLIDNVDGTPSIYVAYATAQDGIASPADWNGSINAAVRDIRDGKNGSQTGPDADGYYKATLSSALPADAKMVTGAIGINYAGLIQLGLTAYPNGILLREPQFVMKTATGHTARRQVVDNAKCNKCHGQLGILPTFHGGARNNGEGCAICHDPNRSTGHGDGGGWSVAIKNLVHGIHGSSKRTQAYSYEASSTNLTGFKEVTFPGILKNCEQCHVSGSYDYSGTAIKSALDAKSLLWFTDTKADMTGTSFTSAVGLSPWISAQDAKGKINYNTTTTNLVSSPIASSCFGCHDSTDAVAHMENNGGVLVRLWSNVSSTARPTVGATTAVTFNKTEQCMFCHSSTSSFGLGIKAVHAK